MFLFYQKMELAKRGGLDGPGGTHTTPGRGPHLGRALVWCGVPGPPQTLPLRVLHPPETLRHGESQKKYSAASTGRKQQREKKLSGREKSAREIPSRRGEIIAILIVIVLDFIGVIIIIISTAITTITAAPSRSAVTSRAILCLVHRGNSPGVNYSLWLMLLSFIGELKYMFRLLSIITSPLIMIHMMSCE